VKARNRRPVGEQLGWFHVVGRGGAASSCGTGSGSPKCSETGQTSSSSSSGLSGSLLADLPSLELIAFDASSIVDTLLLVMAVAFLAWILPAARAAKADPVESLRYE
jgi:hypothetical protein